jgi:hypothetical protein
MLKLTPQGKQKYAIVTIGTIILKNNNRVIKCGLCGKIVSGNTQQNQIQALFECLGTHIPAKYLYQTYEQQDDRIVTSIDKEIWDSIKKSIKYKK